MHSIGDIRLFDDTSDPTSALRSWNPSEDVIACLACSVDLWPRGRDYPLQNNPRFTISLSLCLGHGQRRVPVVIGNTIISSEENVRYFIKVFEACTLPEKILLFLKISRTPNARGLNSARADGVGDPLRESHPGVKTRSVEGNPSSSKPARSIRTHHYLEY